MTTTNPMGSGNEVESAAFHVPVSVSHQLPPARTGFRGKLDELKSRGLSKVQGARVSMRDGANGQMTKVRSSMKTKPMLWAGIAAGTGFALGLAGRIADSRRKSRRMYPDLVIIDATC
jgi:hypothetical protein